MRWSTRKVRTLRPDPDGGAPVNRDRRPDPGVIDGEVAIRVDAAAHAAAAADVARRKPARSPRRGPSARRRPRACFRRARRRSYCRSRCSRRFWLPFFCAEEPISPRPTRAVSLRSRRRCEPGEEAQRQAPPSPASTSGWARWRPRSGGHLEAAKHLSALDAANAANAPKIAAALEAATRIGERAEGRKSRPRAVQIPGLSARGANSNRAARAQTAAGAPEISDLDDASTRSRRRSQRPRRRAASPRRSPRRSTTRPLSRSSPRRCATSSPGSPVRNRTLGVAESRRTATGEAGAAEGPGQWRPHERGACRRLSTIAPQGARRRVERARTGDALTGCSGPSAGLVQVRDSERGAGDDPVALVSQIEAESRRGDSARRWPLSPSCRSRRGVRPPNGRPRPARSSRRTRRCSSICTSAIEKLAAGGKS